MVEIEGILNSNLSKFILDGKLSDIFNNEDILDDQILWSVQVKRQNLFGCLFLILGLIFCWIQVRKYYRIEMKLMQQKRLKQLIQLTIMETPEFTLPMQFHQRNPDLSSSEDEGVN